MTKTMAGQTFDFSYIAAGTFIMGSPEDDTDAYNVEKNQRVVTLTKGFLLLQTEITQGQYLAVIGKNPSYFSDSTYPDAASRPVERVRWTEAVAFCDKLSQLDGVSIGTYGLPTEAQWECAARAGSLSPRYAALDTVAWYSLNAGSETHVVKGKQPNSWNLYDMLGNVSEWVADYWSVQCSYGGAACWTTTPLTDPTGPGWGGDRGYRIWRGGDWKNRGALARAATRYFSQPGETNDSCGFRPRRSLP